MVNSGEFSGLELRRRDCKMSALAEEKGFGKATVTFRLKDWGISRQRYWGTPIPMVYCDKDGVVPVAEKDLPVHFAGQRADHASRGISAGECAVIFEHDLPEMRRPGAARDRHDGYVRRFVVVFLSLRRRSER